MTIPRQPHDDDWKYLPLHIQELIRDHYLRGIDRTEELKIAASEGYFAFVDQDLKPNAFPEGCVGVKTLYDGEGRVVDTTLIIAADRKP